jgi:GTP-binding protein
LRFALSPAAKQSVPVEEEPAIANPKSQPPGRVIAIVGRPNVGKSAIFNRLVGARVSIVHEQPGVTRDRVQREAEYNDRRYELIDTGGLGFMDGGGDGGGDPFAPAIRDQVRIAIQDAAVILFVVDAAAGIVGLDDEVARLLHDCGRPIFIAANKADNDRVEAGAVEFAKFGFPVFPISALHNRGFDPLVSTMLKELPDTPPPEKLVPLTVAIVGKPNAGKSSFINRILNNERLIVSPVPGTTRDSVEIPFTIGAGPQARHYQLIDTAGMRHIRRELTAVEKFSILRAEETIERADVVVLMMDATLGPTLQDKKIAGKILEHHKGCVLIVNKWDIALKQGDVTQRAYEKAFRENVPFLNFAPLLFVSAESGFNIRRCIDTIDHVAAQTTRELPTGALNRVLHDATARLQPPMIQGKRMKLYYTTQVGTRPLRFRLFVNNPGKLVPAYEAFLLRCLREAYGLEGAPVLLQLRSCHARADGSMPDAPEESSRFRSRR